MRRRETGPNSSNLSAKFSHAREKPPTPTHPILIQSGLDDDAAVVHLEALKGRDKSYIVHMLPTLRAISSYLNLIIKSINFSGIKKPTHFLN